MNRVVARVKKLKMRSLTNVRKHNKRIDVENTKSQNINLEGHDECVYQKYDGVDLEQAIQNRIDEIPIDQRTKIVSSGKNETTVAVEIVLSASPGYFRRDPDAAGTYDEKRTRAWLDANVKLLKEEYGDNLIEIDAHLGSERTPHLHAVITPIQEQERKHRRTKKQIADNEKATTYTVQAFNAKQMFNRDNLVRFQDITANAVQHLGIKRGIRKLKLEEYTLQDFYKDIQRDTNNSVKLAKREVKKIKVGEPPLINRKQYQESLQKEVDENNENAKNWIGTLFKQLRFEKREKSRYKAICEQFAKFFNMSIDELDNKINSLSDNLDNANQEIEHLNNKLRYAEIEAETQRDKATELNKELHDIKYPQPEYEKTEEQKERKGSKYDQPLEF
jgi:hypothetical protein